MQTVKAGWLRAFRARCADVRKLQDKPFLNIAAVSGLEDMLERYVAGGLCIPHSEAPGFIDELVSVRGCCGGIEYHDTVLLQAVTRARSTALVDVISGKNATLLFYQNPRVAQRILEVLEASKLAELSGTALLHVLVAAQRSSGKHSRLVVAASRQILGAHDKLDDIVHTKGVDGLSTLLRCWWRTGVHRPDLLDPLIERLRTLPIATPRQKAMLLRDLSMHCALHPPAKTAAVVEYAVARLLTVDEDDDFTGGEKAGAREDGEDALSEGGGAAVDRPSVRLVSAARIAGGPFQGASVGLKKDVFAAVGVLYERLVPTFPRTLGWLTPTLAVELAWADVKLEVSGKALMGRVLEHLRAGLLWKEMQPAHLHRLFACAVQADHGGILSAVCHRLATYADPISAPLLTKRAYTMLVYFPECHKFLADAPDIARSGIERLCEIIAQDPPLLAATRSVDHVVARVGHILDALARLRFRHQPLLMGMLTQEPPADVAFPMTHLISVLWSSACFRLPVDCWVCRAALRPLTTDAARTLVAAAPLGDVSALLWAMGRLGVAMPRGLWDEAIAPRLDALFAFWGKHPAHAAAVCAVYAAASPMPEDPRWRRLAEGCGTGAAAAPHPPPGAYPHDKPSPRFELHSVKLPN